MKVFKFFTLFALMFVIVYALMNSCVNNNKEKEYEPKRFEQTVSTKDTSQKKVETVKAKTQDDIRYEELCDITMKHGVNFCYFYKELVRVEDESIRQADRVYNKNYTKEYYEYQEQLYKTEKQKLFAKYKLDLTLYGDIISFGYDYCK